MIPSNVVAQEQRVVQLDEKTLGFVAATGTDFDGLFVAVAIRGPAAASLRHLCYWFGPGGSFTGAALLNRSGGAEFQTLSGSWSLVDGSLCLAENEPARAEAAPGGWLRLSGADGSVVVLQRAVER